MGKSTKFPKKPWNSNEFLLSPASHSRIVGHIPTPRLDNPGPIVPRFRDFFEAASEPRRAVYSTGFGPEEFGLRAIIKEVDDDRRHVTDFYRGRDRSVVFASFRPASELNENKDALIRN